MVPVPLRRASTLRSFETTRASPSPARRARLRAFVVRPGTLPCLFEGEHFAGVDGHKHRYLIKDVSQVGRIHFFAPRNLVVFTPLLVFFIEFSLTGVDRFSESDSSSCVRDLQKSSVCQTRRRIFPCKITPEVFHGVRTADVPTKSGLAWTLFDDKEPAGLVLVAGMCSVATFGFLGAQVETEEVNIGINFRAVERCFDYGARRLVLLTLGYIGKIALLSQIYLPVFDRPFRFVRVDDRGRILLQQFTTNHEDKLRSLSTSCAVIVIAKIRRKHPTMQLGNV